jgi:alpha-beta hydrolase superfamily lysophospholipase
MSAPLASTLSFADHELAVYTWPTAVATKRGTVLLVHGLSEHARRYDHVAERLNAWGFEVCGYDQYGHGLSSGPRGRLPAHHRLIDDLAAVVHHTRQRMHSDTPLLLLGHSMGGLVATSALARGVCSVDALVLSSPAYIPVLQAWQKALLFGMPRWLKGLCVDNGIKPAWIARNPAWVHSYATDPLVHRRISAELGLWIYQEGAHCLGAASTWTTPTLLMYAGDDRIVRPQGSAAFAKDAPAQCLNSHAYEAMYHEIFNDPDNAQVFADLGAWLDRELPR